MENEIDDLYRMIYEKESELEKLKTKLAEKENAYNSMKKVICAWINFNNKL